MTALAWLTSAVWWREVPAPRAGADRVKVLHVYSGNLYGGVERFLVTLARERTA